MYIVNHKSLVIHSFDISCNISDFTDLSTTYYTVTKILNKTLAKQVQQHIKIIMHHYEWIFSKDISTNAHQ